MATADKPGSETPDALVVALAQTGDREAFATLVRRHHAWVRGLLRRLSADSNLADDLAQQAFLQAWKDIAQLRDPKRFTGWLKQLCINLWLKHQRVKDPLRNADSEVVPTPIRETPGMSMDLNRALATLSDRARTCVVLTLVEGLTHAEISDALDLPLGTVKSHVRRGTAQLQDLLSAYQQPKDDAHD